MIIKCSVLADSLGVEPRYLRLLCEEKDGNRSQLNPIKSPDNKYSFDTEDKKNKFWLNMYCRKKGFKFEDLKFETEPEEKSKTTVQEKNKESNQEKTHGVKDIKKPSETNRSDVNSKKNTKASKSITTKKITPKNGYNELEDVFVSDGQKNSNDDEEIDDDFDDMASLLLEEKRSKIEKLNSSIRREAIQIEKLSGSLVPVDEMTYVMSYVVNSITNDTLSHVENAIDIIVKELGGNDDDNKRLKKRSREALVEFTNDKMKELIESIDSVVSKYEETRNRGEKK